MVSLLLFLYIYFPIIISQISSFYVEHGVLIPVFFIFLPIIFFHTRKVSILFCPQLSPSFRFSTAFYSFFYQYGWAFLWTSKDTLDARQQRTLAACKFPEQVSILMFPAE